MNIKKIIESMKNKIKRKISQKPKKDEIHLSTNFQITLILSLIIILGIYQCKEENTLRIENERESGSTVSLRNFKRDAFNEKGELIWKLKAKEAFVYTTTNKSIFYGLDFDQYEKGKVNSKLKSDRGEIDQKEKKLFLNGNIDLITDDSKHLKAEELNYDLETEQLTTDKPVVILMKGTTIRGVGLEADKGLNKVKILKPAGVSSDNPLEKKE